MIKKFSFMLFMLLNFFQHIDAKVLIITHAFNRPDFIEFQCRLFQKFLKDEYEFVVFNDATSQEFYGPIIETCNKLGIQCINIPQEIHNKPYSKSDLIYSISSRRHANAIQYSLIKLGFEYPGTVVLLDSDLFLIRPFSFEETLSDCDIAAVIRKSITRCKRKHNKHDLHANDQIKYFWPGLTILAMDKLPNKNQLSFSCGLVHRAWVDTGGGTYKYVEANQHLRIKELNQVFGVELFCADRLGDFDNRQVQIGKANYKIPLLQQHVELQRLGFSENEINFILNKPDTINFACDNNFLHYRAACGWDGVGGHPSSEYNVTKTRLVKNFIENILND